MKPEPKRLSYNDQQHRYWLDGKPATGVSTVAKGFQDSYNLDRKIKRDVAKGMARRPDLCSVVVALGDADDWETKKKIDKVATDAIEASGAWAKANHGTAKHTILERVHKGLSLDDVFDDRLIEYAKAYEALINAAGIIPIAHLTERFIVYPQEMIAGRMDCAYLHNGVLLAGDFKSGQRAVSYPHSIVAQLGLYLNAPFLYNEETDEFDPAPLWGDRIIIAHVPDDTTQFGLWEIDAALAKQVALAALERHRYIKSGADSLVKQWIMPTTGENEEWPSATKTDTGSTSSSTTSPTPPRASFSTTPKSSTSSSSVATDSTRSSQSSPADAFDGLVDGYVAPPAKPERRAWVIGRLETLAGIDGALNLAKAWWPAGLATLKQSDRHTDADLDRIVAVLECVEDEYEVPFNVPDPTIEKEEGRWTTTNANASPISSTEQTTNSKSQEQPSPPTPPTCSTSMPPEQDDVSTTSSMNSPDEGPDADEGAVAALHAAYEALPAEGRSWIAGLARDAQQAGRPIHLQGAATIRRFEIVRGLVALAGNGCDDDDVVRGLLELVLTDSAFSAAIAPGELISYLDWKPPEGTVFKFARLCDALTNGDLVASVADDGVMRFVTA